MAEWIVAPKEKPFLTKVRATNLLKLPSHEALTNSIHGLRRRLKDEMDPQKRYRLKVIRQELCRLRDQLY